MPRLSLRCSCCGSDTSPAVTKWPRLKPSCLAPLFPLASEATFQQTEEDARGGGSGDIELEKRRETGQLKERGGEKSMLLLPSPAVNIAKPSQTLRKLLRPQQKSVYERRSIAARHSGQPTSHPAPRARSALLLAQPREPTSGAVGNKSSRRVRIISRLDISLQQQRQPCVAAKHPGAMHSST